MAEVGIHRVAADIRPPAQADTPQAQARRLPEARYPQAAATPPAQFLLPALPAPMPGMAFRSLRRTLNRSNWSRRSVDKRYRSLHILLPGKFFRSSSGRTLHGRNHPALALNTLHALPTNCSARIGLAWGESNFALV